MAVEQNSGMSGMVGRYSGMASLAGISFFRDTTQIGDGAEDIASGTVVGIGYTGNNNHVTVPIQFLDSPSTTSATTYKLQVAAVGADSTPQMVMINSPYKSVHSADTNAYIIRGTSTITAMEVSA